ncbi:hypothetical protein AAFC00_004513 [Neodothiora populina]|uniref:Uncharacterized protein n=1 Tax=Neodothiora populina TaxID=2781224 RepID=A0ABR3P3L6_9PEZI
MPAYGRGGAGNIEAATNPSVIIPTASVPAANNSASKDLEKNQQQAEDYLDSRTSLANYAGTAHDSLHNQQYAHMGRGGAGNYYSPWELQMRGEFTGAGTSHVLGDGTPQPKSQETESQGGSAAAAKSAQQPAPVKEMLRGRGGAGNFSYGVSESEEKAWRKKQEEEERKKAELRNAAEKSAEDSLARPEKAKVPAGAAPY